MSRNLYLGVDGGGGTTECLIADENGMILGRGLAGGSNIYSSGEENTARALKDVMLSAGVTMDDNVESACFGLSGVIQGLENVAINNIVKTLLPDTDKIQVVCDAITTLTGSIGPGAGICINAGTGAICAGRGIQGEIAISSGWGHLLGDEGSGYWIGSQGLIAALRSFDGREKETILLDKLLGALGTTSPQAASQIVHQSDNPRVIFSDLCPIVLECAQNGDPVAKDIVSRAGHELALAVWSVAGSLSLLDRDVDVAPVGNCLLKSELLQENFKAATTSLIPMANIVMPKYSPVVGGVLMAMMADGIDTSTLNMDQYSRLISKG